MANTNPEGGGTPPQPPPIVCEVEVEDGRLREHYRRQDSIRPCGKPAAPVCAYHLGMEREARAAEMRLASANIDRLRGELLALANGVTDYERARASVLTACESVRQQHYPRPEQYPVQPPPPWGQRVE